MNKDPVSKTKDVRAAVEKELGFDPGVDAADIAVRNIAGDVTLTGTVPSYPQYLEAAAAARRVAGVTGVHNHLEVALPEGTYRDDVKLAAAANNALAANVTVPDTVEATAEDGNITLTGTVSYGTERAAAEAAVAGLAGVRNVFDDIEISYALDPVEVDLHVQQALDRAALVPDDSDVTADTKDGIITLTGHVRTWAEHDAVIGAALMARGVIDIRDELRSPADGLPRSLAGGLYSRRGRPPPQDCFADLGGGDDRQGHGGAGQPLPDVERDGLHHGVENAQDGRQDQQQEGPARHVGERLVGEGVEGERPSPGRLWTRLRRTG